MLVRERPILFSGESVRQLLAGVKTQTRRVVNPPPHPAISSFHDLDGAFKPGWGRGLRDVDDAVPYNACIGCPYGQPGDRLWCRETWQYADWTEDGYPLIRYQSDGATSWRERGIPESLAEQVWAPLSVPENFDIDGKAADRRWRPSIFMPRWASRLTLEITDVRVERLQDISYADVIDEGCPTPASTLASPDDHDWYIRLWDSLNAKRKGGAFSWASNPLVWVLTFRVLAPDGVA